MNSLFSKIEFIPLIPSAWLILAITIIALYLTLAVFKLRFSAIWRGLFFIALLGAIANPNISTIKSRPQKDVAAIIIDNSSSMKATKRQNGANLAAKKILDRLKTYPNLELRSAIIQDAQNGTLVSKALETAFLGIEEERIAGAIYIGDGNIQTSEIIARNYPIHQIIIGEENEIDRRIEILKAPISAPVGTIAQYRLKIVQTGNAGLNAQLKIYVGNNEERQINVKVNQEFDLDIPIETRGKIPIALEVSEANGEISKANNAQSLSIIGISDSLRVLLVTGEPYEGARAWRNLLKSDPNIDLVHFTILRGPEDADDEFNSELSLIPFPTDELFFEHLDDFDLIVFDRFMKLDALPDYYLARVANWIENGGGFLLLAGPDELENNGIMSTPLARLMPISGAPIAINEEFKPSLTDAGSKHPITKNFALAQNTWGNWPSAIKFEAQGDTLLSANGTPLLVTKLANKGRVGIILSDKAWVWQRGYQTGGPFRELMARIIHWLLKDPELEAEKLSLKALGGELLLSYNGLALNSMQAKIIGPNSNWNLDLVAGENGQIGGKIANPDFGLYRAHLGNLASNLNFAIKGETDRELIATNRKINGGKSVFIGKEATGNMPEFAPSAAINFANPRIFGLKNNNFQSKESFELVPVLPPLAYAFMLSLLALLAWFIEKKGDLRVWRNRSFSKANDSD